LRAMRCMSSPGPKVLAASKAMHLPNPRLAPVIKTRERDMLRELAVRVVGKIERQGVRIV